jgi:hypothetical protein
MEKNLNLRTIKRASQETGASQSFFRQLIREGKLKKYSVNTAVYVSLAEFEKICQPTEA